METLEFEVDTLPEVSAAVQQLNTDQRPVFDEIMAWAEREPAHDDWLHPERDFYTLRGFAGVGKTFLTACIVETLSRAGYTVAVAAPTNKAVSVLELKIQELVGDLATVEYASIHSFVGMRMVEAEDGTMKISRTGRGRLEMYDYAIVDEGSMVDNNVFDEIKTCKDKCRVIFVGDPAQLPPVGLGKISPVFDVDGSMMTKIVRQAEGNPIIQASMKIRQNIDANQRTQISELMDWLPGSMVHGTRDMVQQAIELQRSGKDARILAYRNATVISYNQRIHEALHGSSAPMFVPGERVIVQQRSKGIDLATGKEADLLTSEELDVIDVGEQRNQYYPGVDCVCVTLKNDFDQEIVVYVPRVFSVFDKKCAKNFRDAQDLKDDVEDAKKRGREWYPLQERYKEALAAAWGFKNAFCEIRHTYASTVHKSQGSTYDIALIDFGDIQGMVNDFEFNRSLYVSVTRPRESVRIAF